MLKAEHFKEVVKNTPLIALDLIVIDKEGRILLGLRNNNPGKGSWSVPGGRIYKNEILKEAFKRISKNELGLAVDVNRIRFRGIYEHFYQESVFNEANINTHYVTIACEVKPAETDEIALNSQHNQYKYFSLKELLGSKEVLENTKHFFVGTGDDLFRGVSENER